MNTRRAGNVIGRLPALSLRRVLSAGSTLGGNAIGRHSRSANFSHHAQSRDLRPDDSEAEVIDASRSTRDRSNICSPPTFVAFVEWRRQLSAPKKINGSKTMRTRRLFPYDT
jgi:hypothetical protein